MCKIPHVISDMDVNHDRDGDPIKKSKTRAIKINMVNIFFEKHQFLAHSLFQFSNHESKSQKFREIKKTKNRIKENTFKLRRVASVNDIPLRKIKMKLQDIILLHHLLLGLDGSSIFFSPRFLLNLFFLISRFSCGAFLFLFYDSFYNPLTLYDFDESMIY